MRGALDGQWMVFELGIYGCTTDALMDISELTAPNAYSDVFGVL